MKNLIKKFCRWVLSEEISTLKKELKSERELSFKLATRLEPYKPAIVPNGEDMADAIQFSIDVSCGLRENCCQIPTGTITVGSPIIVSSNTVFTGDK